MSADPQRGAEIFVLEEARMLDERRYAEWPALFAADGWYWMPSHPDQESPHTAVSLIYEDRRLLEMRARRLLHPATPMENPPQRAHRHLSNIVARVADDAIEVHSLLMLVSWRNDLQQVYSARCHHRLVRSGSGLVIRNKTVRLLNCDAPLPAFAAPF